MPSKPRWKLSDAYLAVPLEGSVSMGVLQACVVARREPDPVAGHFVTLREEADARVLLGCLLDAGGRVHRWLEMAFQDIDRVARGLHGARQAVTNRLLDDRWQSNVEACDAVPDAPLFRIGWEADHPAPTYVDLKTGSCVTPGQGGSQGETAGAWRLCVDDAALTAAGLPAYGGSLHRYWRAGTTGSFAPTSADAPTNDRCVTREQALMTISTAPALNPGAGLLRIREHLPLMYESFIDVLGGEAWEGVRHGRQAIDLGPDLDEPMVIPEGHLLGEDWLFQGRHGRAGRIIETLHLKIRMLGDAIAAVHRHVRMTQAPLLNLNADSFRVRLATQSAGLPRLWAASAVLVDPGAAIRLPIRGTDTAYFARGQDGLTVYHPVSAAAAPSGRGVVRLRGAVSDTDKETILEGTFDTQERFTCARNDLVWLRLTVRDKPVDLYARFDEQAAMASGEKRFRTVPHQFSTDLRSALKDAAGIPLGNVPFEVVPLLTSPQDMYALGVLGVRTLLVNRDNTLPVALDELLSLARQLQVEYDEHTPLRERIATIMARDPRWQDSLGPHRLLRQSMDPAEARDLIPAELWYDVLATLVRLFPGAGPDSHCRDFADAPSGGIHRIFDPVLKNVGDLIVKSRSLIVIDWRFNREIHAVLRQIGLGIGAR
ncbi:MAG: hypothetical protein HRU76_12085 [Phycisphaeraceae bacterium]|nr:hypothetical protein [Phycisphaerales bacterium]QOJ18279.1 MAG: hypothetical protein HRU76_12085 [Phycisphaeraceae bacterium]